MLTLKNERVLVEITSPGEAGNEGIHWDRAGFVSRICLDGKYEFCAHEPEILINPDTGDSLNHATGGAGLCGEIREDQIWEETPVGEIFPKFGTGLVHKNYDGRFKPYLPAGYTPFQVIITPISNGYIFETLPMACRGYALHHKKILTLENTTLTMQYEFENTGEKLLNLNEYIHNYLTINSLPIGPDYRITFPSVYTLEGKKPRSAQSTVYGKENYFTFTGYNAVDAMIHITEEDIDPQKSFSWKMTHLQVPAWISEEDSFIPSRVPFWSVDHILAPEVNYNFSLAPSASHSYWRKWTIGD